MFFCIFTDVLVVEENRTVQAHRRSDIAEYPLAERFRDPLNFVSVIGRDGQSPCKGAVGGSSTVCFVENFYLDTEDLLSDISILRLSFSLPFSRKGRFTNDKKYLSSSLQTRREIRRPDTYRANTRVRRVASSSTRSVDSMLKLYYCCSSVLESGISIGGIIFSSGGDDDDDEN